MGSHWTAPHSPLCDIQCDCCLRPGQNQGVLRSERAPRQSWAASLGRCCHLLTFGCTLGEEDSGVFGNALTCATHWLEMTPRFYQMLTGLDSVTGTLPRGTPVLTASNIQWSRVTRLAGLSPVPPRYGGAMFLAGSGRGPAILSWGSVSTALPWGEGVKASAPRPVALCFGTTGP